MRIDLARTRGGRRLLFALLYLAEGAPIGFIWWAIPTRLREAGVPVETIATLTSVIILPWALKFLWAPLVDVLRGPRWGRRAWVVAMQGVMGLSLLPLALLDWQASLGLLFALLLIHAFAAATQDVAIDAWAISVTPREELGGINGFMQLGMLSGRWLFGAGFLLVAHRINDFTAVLAMIGVIWTTTLVVLLASDRVEEPAGPGARRFAAFLATLGNVLRRRQTWLGLGLALMAFAGFKAAGDLAGPFLVDLGLATADVGWFFSAALLAMIAGALLGGRLADRLGPATASRRLVLLTAVVIAATSGITVTGAAAWPWITAGMLGIYACAGLLTASGYALLMRLTDPRLGATQFSAYMGAINACEAWAGFSAGQLAGRFDYPLAFLAIAALSLLALPLLARLRQSGHP